MLSGISTEFIQPQSALHNWKHNFAQFTLGLFQLNNNNIEAPTRCKR